MKGNLMHTQIIVNLNKKEVGESWRSNTQITRQMNVCAKPSTTGTPSKQFFKEQKRKFLRFYNT